MNNDIYAEWLVKRKNPAYLPLVYVGYVLAVLIGLLACMVNSFGFILLLAVIFGIYFLNTRMKVEFEYVFVTNELSIDRIYAQRSRKRVQNLEMQKIERIIPVKSHEYDFARNNPKLKVIDYSSGKKDAEVYAIVYNGNQGQQVFWFEPNDKVLKCLKNSAPRKVLLAAPLT